MAPEGSARCLARRSVVGALLASTASLAAAGPAKASRTQRKDEMIQSKLATQTTRPVFEHGRRLQQENSIRLVGGSHDREGRVEIFHGGQWGTVCDDDWDIADANVVCQQLFRTAAVEATEEASFGEGSGPILMDNVACAGSEDALSDCPFDSWGESDCSHSEDAGVSCIPTCDDVTPGTFSFDDVTIRVAVKLWFVNHTIAECTYGHISTWETGGGTDMSYLFCATSIDYSGAGYCNTAAVSFNEDIGAWDTSGVTRMRYMFYVAEAFNQDIGAWDTSGVTTMYKMFYYASAFDQDLGWCVDNYVYLDGAFLGTPCASTSCGVERVADGCAPAALASDAAASRSAAFGVLLGAAALLML